MATATETPSRPITPEASVGKHRSLIHNVSREKYEALLEIFGDDGPRMSDCRGEQELISPLIQHERPKNLFGYMIETIIVELNIRAKALGSTTFKRQLAEQGLEPDECYYVANAGKLVSKRRPDLDIDPPPDLVIGVEITSSLVKKLDIYAGIGVPEIWRYDGELFSVLRLQPDRSYQKSENSLAFPFLPLNEIARFLQVYDEDEETAWRRSFQAWVRDVLLPIHRADQPE